VVLWKALKEVQHTSRTSLADVSRFSLAVNQVYRINSIRLTALRPFSYAHPSSQPVPQAHGIDKTGPLNSIWGFVFAACEIEPLRRLRLRTATQPAGAGTSPRPPRNRHAVPGTLLSSCRVAPLVLGTAFQVRESCRGALDLATKNRYDAAG
jgi:hypothetical protein